MKVTKIRTIIKFKAREGHDMPRTNHSGFTLIELMITIAVLGILAAIALPSFQSTLERLRVKGAAENFFADLQFARTEAIKQNRNIQFQVDDASWCYGIDDTLADCNCADSPNDCTVSGQVKIQAGSAYKDVNLTIDGLDGDNLVFNPRQGMPVDPDDNSDFVFSINNYSKTVSVNSIGRITLD